MILPLVYLLMGLYRMQVGFACLTDLAVLRIPARQKAVDLLFALAVHPGESFFYQLLALF